MHLSISHTSIHWEAAHAAVRAAVEHARGLGILVNAAVVDRSGMQTAFLRMPGASFHSMDVALDKAYTAASFGFPTRDWNRVLATFSNEVRDGIIQRPRLIVFGGGFPIIHGGELIGAIGVSGGTEEQDEACARAALQAIGAQLPAS